MQSVRLSNASLSIYICRSVIGTKYLSALYTSTGAFLQSLRSRPKFGYRVSLRWRPWRDSRELHPQKVFPKFSSDASYGRDPKSIFYIGKQNIRFKFLIILIRLQLFSPQSLFYLNICIELFEALQNVSWRYWCCYYWTQNGCNYVSSIVIATAVDTRVGKEMFSLLSAEAEDSYSQPIPCFSVVSRVERALEDCKRNCKGVLLYRYTVD